MHKEFLQILSDEHPQTTALLATIDMIKQQLKRINMAIIQVAYEVPDDVVEGLATGVLTRYGSMIRGHTGYKLHLKEVPIPQPENITAVELSIRILRLAEIRI